MLSRLVACREELAVMALASGATVIVLQSHPVWVAAQQRGRERSEAMRRHPSFFARKLSAARGDNDISTREPTGARPSIGRDERARWFRRQI